MNRLRLPTILMTLAVLAAAGPSLAQVPLDDPLDARDAKRVERMEKVVRELRSIVFQLRDTGKPVIVQPADTDARIAEMASKLSDLETTLRSLNGSFEAVTREADQARRENAQLRKDIAALSERLATVEQKQAQAVAPPPFETAPPPAAAAGDPAKDFLQARQLMLAGDYDAAEAAFSAFVEAYPDASRNPEARYWLGKTLGVRGAYAEAAKAYIGAIRGWPQTPWAPDAVVDLARALVALKKPTDACQTLTEFTRRYPKAQANVVTRAAATRTLAKCAA